MLFGSLGILLLGFFWFPSMFPRARTPIQTTLPVTLSQHTVDVRTDVEQTLKQNSTATVLIFLEKPTNLKKVAHTDKTKKMQERTIFYTDLKTKTEAIQSAVLAKIPTSINTNHLTIKKSFFVDNVLLATVDQTAIETLKKTPGVLSIIPNEQIMLPPLTPATTQAAPEWNITKIGADRVWNELGITGQGVVVANIDSGVQWDHPALKAKYRGWDGTTASHDYNWFDPTLTSPTVPLDNSGHGTHTMGTIVGGDETHTIGVAPGAKWIAAKACGAGGGCYNSDLITAGQWMLAPTKLDGTGADPTKAPDVISNSWGGQGCQTWYMGVVDSWNNAGIFSDFSAGNSGPNTSTIGSPGDFPQSFSVGATDASDNITSFSSRGPSCSTFGSQIKPDIAAPGANILSSIPYDSYTALNGTSMAAPHIAGVVALLLQAKPNLTPYEIGYLLKSTSTDLGSSGPDNAFGSGLINAYKAITTDISTIPTQTPTPPPIPTPTPMPPPITVTYPNGGESFLMNQPVTITWNYYLVSWVYIYLVDKNNNQVYQIADSINASTKSFTWLANSNGNTNGPYKIKIVAKDNVYQTGVSDYSDGTFTIVTPTPTIAPTPIPTATPTPIPPFIRLVYPNGGEALNTTTPINITWSYDLRISKISLYLEPQNDVAILLANNITNQIAYNWYPQDYGRKYYKIHIFGSSIINGQEVISDDLSDNWFTISTPMTPTPTITQPPTPTDTPMPTPTPTLVACRQTDVNRDGIVNETDIAIVVSSFWQAPASNPRADINSDGIVDITDYSLVARDFGTATGTCQ